MGRKTNPARVEARSFVNSGRLRDCLEKDRTLSKEGIEQIMNACYFVLGC